MKVCFVLEHRNRDVKAGQDVTGSNRHPALGIEKFCSRCGGALSPRVDGGRERPWCAACGRFVFGRFSVGVGGFLKHDGRVLMVQRGKDPGKGRWTFPGGFLEEDEAPDEGLVREVFEETGLRVSVDGLLAVRHVATDSEQNLYCVYRLSLSGPLNALREGGDGDEVSAATFVDPGRLSEFGDVGGVTKWIVENADDDAPLMKPVRSDFLLLPKHRWSVLLVPEQGDGEIR